MPAFARLELVCGDLGGDADELTADDDENADADALVVPDGMVVLGCS